MATDADQPNDVEVLLAGLEVGSISELRRLVLAGRDGEKETRELREALRDQWGSAHFDHCGREWPHPPGKRCFWPLPAVLRDAEPPE